MPLGVLCCVQARMQIWLRHVEVTYLERQASEASLSHGGRGVEPTRLTQAQRPLEPRPRMPQVTVRKRDLAQPAQSFGNCWRVVSLTRLAQCILVQCTRARSCHTTRATTLVPQPSQASGGVQRASAHQFGAPSRQRQDLREPVLSLLEVAARRPEFDQHSGQALPALGVSRLDKPTQCCTRVVLLAIEPCEVSAYSARVALFGYGQVVAGMPLGGVIAFAGRRQLVEREGAHSIQQAVARLSA